MTDWVELTREQMLELACEVWRLLEASPQAASSRETCLTAQLRALGCPENELALWRWRIGHLPIGDIIDKGYTVDAAEKAAKDLHDVAAQLPALTKIGRDLEYRLPGSNRPLGNIALTRQQCIDLLAHVARVEQAAQVNE